MVLVHLLPVRGRDWTNSTAGRQSAPNWRTWRPRRPPPGLVAYRDDRAVGWVSLGPREDYARLAHSKILAPVDDTPVWSIVCFVVSRRARGQGVATALLDGGDRLRPAPRRDDARGVSGRHGGREDRRRERVSRHALGCSNGRLRRVAERRQWNSRPSPVRPIVRARVDIGSDTGA